MSEKDKIMKQLYECCLNATGAYRALTCDEPHLPGYNRCKQNLDAAIAVYEDFRKQQRKLFKSPLHDECPNCEFKEKRGKNGYEK